MIPSRPVSRVAGPALAALALALSVPLPISAQQDFSNVRIEATHVSGAVWMLVGQGGNIAVSSGPDGALMVDDQYAPLAERIRAALREVGRGAEASDLRFVLNTHWHGDHTGGNMEFGGEATIIAHDNVRERMSTPQERNGNVTPPSPAEALPVITFDRSVHLHFNGERVVAFHVPQGHTDGDAVIYFEGSNVVHMGDDFFAGGFPFVDLASGGSVEGLQAGVARVLDEIPQDARIIPGHGPLSSVEDLRLYHRMLSETIGSVRRQLAGGATPEEIRARGVSDEWAGWGDGFISTDRWLDTIVQSLSGSGDADEQDWNAHGHGSTDGR